jgi:hypothetical protein
MTEGSLPRVRTTFSLGAMVLGFDGASWSYAPLSLNPQIESLSID